MTIGVLDAKYLSLYSNLSLEDHVIVHHPTYQQLYEVSSSLGAEMDLWEAYIEDLWIPRIEKLKALIKPNTKIIIIR